MVIIIIFLLSLIKDSFHGTAFALKNFKFHFWLL